MKLSSTTSLIIRLSLAAAFLIAGMTRAAAQITGASISATPALIMSFDGHVVNDIADLTWVMENETNSKWFVVERSGELGGYDSIGVVTGLNNNSMTTYTFTDNNMLNGGNYYRLRMIDKDGVVRYSKVVSLYNQQSQTAAGASMAVYPNPAVATINYTISSTSSQQVVVQVYNLAGVVLMTSEQQLYAGNNLQTVAVSSLKAGNYFLKVTSLQGAAQYVQPFVKIM
ncbi:MAG TPA: T9SS type A sorting domain-containing protein [Puia sp.]|nr:T9SS type A sorting domain-containing protein [Puia sp.]